MAQVAHSYELHFANANLKGQSAVLLEEVLNAQKITQLIDLTLNNLRRWWAETDGFSKPENYPTSAYDYPDTLRLFVGRLLCNGYNELEEEIRQVIMTQGLALMTEQERANHNDFVDPEEIVEQLQVITSVWFSGGQGDAANGSLLTPAVLARLKCAVHAHTAMRFCQLMPYEAFFVFPAEKILELLQRHSTACDFILQVRFNSLRFLNGPKGKEKLGFLT